MNASADVPHENARTIKLLVVGQVGSGTQRSGATGGHPQQNECDEAQNSVHRYGEAMVRQLTGVSISSPASSPRLIASPAGNHIDLQLRICGWHVRRRQPELAPYDIAALRDCTRLVERDFPVAALTSETAVARYD